MRAAVGMVAAAMAAAALAGLTSLPGGYEQWPAVKKLEYLMARVNEDRTSGPFHSVDWEQLMKFLQKSYLRETTGFVSDELPPEHKKYIHAVGAVGAVHFEWDDGAANDFTGLFRGADTCMARFSSAATPMPVPDNYLLPGVAIKCLRDGVESGNFVSMWQLDGYASYPPNMTRSCNYFAVPFCNHVANRDDLPFAIRTGVYISFARVDSAPGFVGLSGFARYAQDGAPVESPKFPFALVFSPTEAARGLPCDNTVSLSQLKNIEPGMALYDVYAVREPVREAGGKPDMFRIGRLKADSAFTPSKYGDETLFFRHDFFAADQAYRPQWRGLESDNRFKALEGALRYAPFLPGGERLNFTQASAMLASDSELVV